MKVETPHLSKALLTAQQLADQLNISRSSLYRKRSLGQPLPVAISFGGSLRWTQESVEKFLEENTEQEVFDAT